MCETPPSKDQVERTTLSASSPTQNLVEHSRGHGTQDEEGFQHHFPAAHWVWARTHDTTNSRFPQTIAHRGYKAAYPENTMEAFKGAVGVGAHALETDIHLTKDDVVVLSHDPDLKRCFGREEKLIDCEWDFVSRLRTIRQPQEPMPKLKDLLEYVAQPAQQDIWLLLDIKLDNDADKVMRLISETIQSVNPGRRPWANRLVLGIWAAKFLPLCKKYLPGYSVSYIGFSTFYARKFVAVSNISFNILQKILLGPLGSSFIRTLKRANRPLFVWTVNEANLMKWSIQHDADGVITDDPKLFNEICANWKDNEPVAKPSWAQWLYTFWLHFIILVFSFSFRRRFPEPIEKHFISANDLRARASLSLGA